MPILIKLSKAFSRELPTQLFSFAVYFTVFKLYIHLTARLFQKFSYFFCTKIVHIFTPVFDIRFNLI